MIRKLFLFCILLLLTNCGYEPIYVKSNNSSLNFGAIKTSGNEKINKRITEILEKFYNAEYKNTYPGVSHEKG